MNNKRKNRWAEIEKVVKCFDLDSNTNESISEILGESLSDLYLHLKSESTEYCKKHIKNIDGELYKQEKYEKFKETIYLSFIKHMVEKRVVHDGLLECEGLLLNKVNSFISSVKKNKQYPNLSSDEGTIPLMIFLGKYVPLETYHADVVGISRAILLKASFVNKLKLFKYIVTRMHGLSPVLAYHLPKSMDKRFTLDAVISDYMITVDIFKANEKLRSTYQASWFLDPELCSISPHLGKIGAFSENDRSLLVCLGETISSTQDAILKSKTRKKLYEQGLYRPKRFLRLWSRKDILQWSNEYIRQKFDEE